MNDHKNAPDVTRSSAHGAREAGGYRARTAYRGCPLSEEWQHFEGARRGPASLNALAARRENSRVEQPRRDLLTGSAIAGTLGMARSPVGLILRRARRRLLEPKASVIRYKRGRPGPIYLNSAADPDEIAYRWRRDGVDGAQRAGSADYDGLPEKRRASPTIGGRDRSGEGGR